MLGIEIEKIKDEAADLGREEGWADASWTFDGNTSEETYRHVLTGVEEGDPGVLDMLPAADLSGQHADAWTPQSLAVHLGVDPDEIEGRQLDEITDAYEWAFNMVTLDEVERMARAYLGEVRDDCAAI